MASPETRLSAKSVVVQVGPQTNVELTVAPGSTILSGQILTRVATEAFFCRPADLRDENPDVYDLLRAYYRADPGAWFTDR